MNIKEYTEIQDKIINLRYQMKGLIIHIRNNKDGTVVFADSQYNQGIRDCIKVVDKIFPKIK